MPAVCLLASDGVPAADIAELDVSLTARAIRVDPSRVDARGAVIFALGAVSLELCRALRDRSLDGRGRVLVLAFEPLAAREAWLLLKHGASDVITWRRLPVSRSQRLPDGPAIQRRRPMADGVPSASARTRWLPQRP